MTKIKKDEFEKDMCTILKKEYNDMIESSAKKEIEREKSYRKYFKGLGKKINMREKIYEDTIIPAEKEREKQYKEWVNKNELLYQSRLKAQEEYLDNQRKVVLFMLIYRI